MAAGDVEMQYFYRFGVPGYAPAITFPKGQAGPFEILAVYGTQQPPPVNAPPPDATLQSRAIKNFF